MNPVIDHEEERLYSRFDAAADRYLDLQAQIERERRETGGAPTSQDLLIRAQLARIELDELKRELASLRRER